MPRWRNFSKPEDQNGGFRRITVANRLGCFAMISFAGWEAWD